MVRAVFRPEADITLCALKKSSKHSENVFRQKSYSYFPGNGGRRSERRGQLFDCKLVNRRFWACAMKNRSKTPLLCCQIAKILAPLWAIAVAEHTTVFEPDKNLILSADCNKTANINVKKLNSLKQCLYGDTAYITQLKRQKSKKVLLLLQHVAIMSTFSYV